MLKITEIPQHGAPRTWTAESEDDFCIKVQRANPRGDWDADWSFEQFREYLGLELLSLDITNDQDTDEDFPAQPDRQAVLGCGLTITEILDSIFFGAERRNWQFESLVNPDDIAKKLTARNERTGFSAQWVRSEYYDDDLDRHSVEFMVELKFGAIYVSGDWTLPAIGSRADEAHFKALSEAAFMSACSLIGKRAARKLAVL